VDGSPELDEAVCLTRITDTLGALKEDFADVEATLKKFFESTKT
jgi:osomolarity two-component system, phosphorelay intermediate protein YPD1